MPTKRSTQQLPLDIEPRGADGLTNHERTVLVSLRTQVLELTLENRFYRRRYRRAS